MIEYLTPASVAAEIRMLRLDTRYKGAIILVEGATDALLFENLVAPSEVTIRWLNGKEKALEALSLLERAGQHGILAIVDADFWCLDGVPSGIGENVMITDAHDVDLMIFASPASRKVAAEYYYGAKFHERLDQEFPKLRRALLEAAKMVGFLRWLNHKESYGLGFKYGTNKTEALDLAPAFDPERLTFDPDKLLQLICPDNPPLRRELQRQMAAAHLNEHDPLQLCNGHDVIQITCIMIKHKGRPHLRDKTDAVGLETAFRLAYERRYFEETDLYKSLLVWQERTGFRIL